MENKLASCAVGKGTKLDSVILEWQVISQRARPRYSAFLCRKTNVQPKGKKPDACQTEHGILGNNREVFRKTSDKNKIVGRA